MIVFLKGGLTRYRWFDFCDRLGYNRNWNPAGRHGRVQTERIQSSVYGDEDTLIRQIVGVDLPLLPTGVVDDYPFADPVEILLESEEGRQELRKHLQRERSAKLVRAFKSSLKDIRCIICEFDFEKAYGELGRGFIEAHHIKPLAEMEQDEKTKISDLVPVFSNCHRMLHRQIPAMPIDELKERMALAHMRAHDY